MAEKLYICRNCRHIFGLEAPNNNTLVQDIRCPACAATDVEGAPCWAPLDSGLNIFEGNTWLYECQDCRKIFKMPIPASPSEEKNRVCPDCSSKHIHCLTIMGGQPLYCG